MRLKSSLGACCSIVFLCGSNRSGVRCVCLLIATSPGDGGGTVQLKWIKLDYKSPFIEVNKANAQQQQNSREV